MALDRRASWAALSRLALIPVISLVVSAATPLGLDAYRSLAAVGSRSDYFSEWGPPDFTSLSSFVLALMIAVAIVLMLVRPARTSWTDALILGTAAAWACSRCARVPEQPSWRRRSSRRPSRHTCPRIPDCHDGRQARCSHSSFSAAPSSPSDSPLGAPNKWFRSGLGPRLDTLPAQTRVLNEWDPGAYFLWRHPQLTLVMHGYGDVFTDSELRRNSDLIELNSGWDRAVADTSMPSTHW